MIYINDIARSFEQPQTLSELLLALNIDDSKGVAVALNNTVISREKWDKCVVNDNDKLLLIKAAQGG
jgi:sulfur carrier protein